MDDAPLILLAAGGTGGHLFPAEALGVELMKRGLCVRLVTDSRAVRYSGLFSKKMIDVVPSETMRGRAPWQLARTGMMLAAGTAMAFQLMRKLRPAAVVGFGGYPTVPTRCWAGQTVCCRAMQPRSQPRCRVCSTAIPRLPERRRPSARRCDRQSLLPRRSATCRLLRPRRSGCWWSVAARARG